MENLEQTLNSASIEILIFACLVLLALAGVALAIKKPTNYIKKILYSAIVAVVLIPTIYLIFSTIYLNVISVSGGPVHWHADYEIYACGLELDLHSSEGLSNKVGTEAFHEHNDKRLHMEGVVVKREDANLGRFFQAVGGELTGTSMKIMTDNGMVSLQNGNNCIAGVSSELQVFVYQTDKDSYYNQKKLINPQNYIIAPVGNVPPGDCIIIEFDAPKLKTDKLCESYKVAEQIGKLKGERNYGY